MSVIRYAAITMVLLLLAVSPVRSEPMAVEREHFIFYFDNQSYIPMAETRLNDTRIRVQSMLGASISYRPSVYLLEDLDTFNRLIRGRFPDWGAAAAFPQRRLMALKSPDKFNINRSLEELLAHEYSHLALADLTGFHSVPRWFDEGLAMLVSTEWGWSDNLAMSKAAVFGQLPTLKSIEKVNRFSESAAHVAYAMSYLAVDYLYNAYGTEAVVAFLNEIQAGSTVDSALLISTGSNYGQFDSELRLHLTKRYNIVSLFMDTIFFWIAMAALVVIGAILKYRKRRHYYRKWQEEEQFQSTDFDYGDPDNPEQVDEGDEPWRS